MKVEKNKESGQREKLRKLQEIAASARDMEENSQNVSGILYQEYSLESRKGRQFYESLEDECLLRLLRERAKELDTARQILSLPSSASKSLHWRPQISPRRSPVVSSV